MVFIAIWGCKKEEGSDGVPPKMTTTQPTNGATNIPLITDIYVNYDSDIALNNDYQVTVNGNQKAVSVSGKQLLIDVELEEGTTYNVNVSGNSVKDLDGDFAEAVSFSFTTRLPNPHVVTSNPLDAATNQETSVEVYVIYDENIELAPGYSITLNGSTTTAAITDGTKLEIDAILEEGVNYTINISGNSIKDVDGNFAESYSFSFQTKAPLGLPSDGKYEAENATFSSTLSILTDVVGYSGTGYVGKFENSSDYLTFKPNGIPEGFYNVYIGYTTAGWGSKVCSIDANGVTSDIALSDLSGFEEVKVGRIKFTTYNNEVTITPNWTWFAIDYIRLEATTATGDPFNIDVNLTTPNPSLQATNVYNFLKENFQQNIISGTMAAHSTNINEATWVHDQTGKWPALTGFDFIDHTWPDQNWVEYEAPLTLSKDWWGNNGLVTISWHWRDPLTKSGSFYTDETTFDITKINDLNSDEYKAMIVDIDTIAGYLRQFKEANIPVLWRPLHEAAGGWFWWGAKGAAPCKALWQLMYDRMVNYHGLNNLIWVWTTNTNSDALDWYPGHDYVDIVSMDIYPGENQHGSQYIEFDKVKEIFEARKIITLSECGSVPDPKLMMEYGDTWSWFMPWNGDFTRSDNHNGATWWDTFFSYDYVLTRDLMPDLK